MNESNDLLGRKEALRELYHFFERFKKTCRDHLFKPVDRRFVEKLLKESGLSNFDIYLQYDNRHRRYIMDDYIPGSCYKMYLTVHYHKYHTMYHDDSYLDIPLIVDKGKWLYQEYYTQMEKGIYDILNHRYKKLCNEMKERQ